MTWLNDLFTGEGVAHTVLLYSVVISAGIFLGRQKIFGISLGITFVLFAGILAGHLGFTANHQVMEFVRDFGLILFVFSIGLQVGPGFFSSFRKGGISLNLLALAIILGGAGITLLIHFITGTPLPLLTGIMSGAVTNTPGLGAAQNAMAGTGTGSGAAEITDMGIGYAVAYPFGVLGIILSMILLKRLFSIDIKKEMEMLEKELHPEESVPDRVNLLVTNPLIFNRTINEISGLLPEEVVISRVLHNGELISATSDTVISQNDIVLAVAGKGLIPELIERIGAQSQMDISSAPGKLISRRVLVTNPAVFGKSLGALRLRTRYNINITRIYRSGMELVASPPVRLQMGDRLTVVGDEKSVEKTATELGNSLKRLNEPNLISVFLGIMLGVILGSIPVSIPGTPNPLRLGLAGGPLIVAILLSKYGYRFSLVPYTTVSANLMLRETGILLFLASVGIMAGEKFVSAFTSGDGLTWMGYGAMITLLPLLAVAFFSRKVLKKNYFEICGLLSGSMTDPPALAYANSLARSEAPAVAYATIYPLVMFMRIFIAQLLIIIFA